MGDREHDEMMDSGGGGENGVVVGGATTTTTPAPNVRRPMNAFLIFCKRHRTILREKNPSADNRTVTRMLGSMWANLEPTQKSIYNDLAKQMREEFLKANPGYKWFNPERQKGGQNHNNHQQNKHNTEKVNKTPTKSVMEAPRVISEASKAGNMDGVNLLLMAGQRSSLPNTTAPPQGYCLPTRHAMTQPGTSQALMIPGATHLTSVAPMGTQAQLLPQGTSQSAFIGSMGASTQMVMPGIPSQPMISASSANQLVMSGASQPLLMTGVSQPLMIPGTYTQPVRPIVSVPTLPVGLGSQLVTSVLDNALCAAGFSVPNIAAVAAAAAASSVGPAHANMVNLTAPANQAGTQHTDAGIVSSAGIGHASFVPMVTLPDMSMAKTTSVTTAAPASNMASSALVNLISAQAGPILQTADPPMSLMSMATQVPVTPVGISTATYSHAGLVGGVPTSYSPQVMLKIPQVTLSSAGLRTISSSVSENCPKVKEEQGEGHLTAAQVGDTAATTHIKTEVTRTSAMLSPTSPLDLRLDARRQPVSSTDQQVKKDPADSNAKCALLQLAEMCSSQLKTEEPTSTSVPESISMTPPWTPKHETVFASPYAGETHGVYMTNRQGGGTINSIPTGAGSSPDLAAPKEQKPDKGLLMGYSELCQSKDIFRNLTQKSSIDLVIEAVIAGNYDPTEVLPKEAAAPKKRARKKKKVPTATLR